MTTLQSIAALRDTILAMERDFGVGHLSQNERDVLYAYQSAASRASDMVDIPTEHARREAIVSDMAHATFHRAVKRLVEFGFIERSPEKAMGFYRIRISAA